MTTAFALLGSATSGGGSSTLTLSGLPTKKYLIVEIYMRPTGSAVPSIRFNNDSGTNYTFRYSFNGGVDNTITSTTAIDTSEVSNSTGFYVRIFIINISAQEKLCIVHSIGQNTAGASTAPSRTEIVGKWTNTASQINEVDVIINGSGNWTSGDNISVYGSD